MKYLVIPPLLQPKIFHTKLKSKKLIAFTLAEVLITLTIIGIIAAMTIPTLMTNVDEKVTATKVKKVYAQLNQSFQIATIDHGTPDEWELEKTTCEELENGSQTCKNESGEKGLDILLSGLKHEEITNEEPYQPKSLDGESRMYTILSPGYRLPDGTTFLKPIHVASLDCKGYQGTSEALQNLCGDVKVDINGSKGPNTLGKDVFLFYITKYGITPSGTQADTKMSLGISTCSTNPSAASADPNRLNGYACTAWIIEKGTMPWLRGKFIDWTNGGREY